MIGLRILSLAALLALAASCAAGVASVDVNACGPVLLTEGSQQECEASRWLWPGGLRETVTENGAFVSRQQGDATVFVAVLAVLAAWASVLVVGRGPKALRYGALALLPVVVAGTQFARYHHDGSDAFTIAWGSAHLFGLPLTFGAARLVLGAWDDAARAVVLGEVAIFVGAFFSLL